MSLKFSVPLNHAEPNGPTISLEAEIWQEPGATGSPVVFLSGGPGERAIALRPHLPWESLVKCRPIVLLNQRGSDLQPNPLPVAPGFLSDPNVALHCLRQQASYAKASAYTPWQSAQDLPYLAKALGIDQFAVIAHSFGTHLTMAAMKACPQILGRIALLGFEGPDQTYKFAAPFEQAAERFPGLETLGERLDQHPFPWQSEGIEIPVNGFGLRWMLASWLGLENRVRKLPALIADPEFHLPSALEGFLKMLRRRSPLFYLHDAASFASDERLAAIREQTSPWAVPANFPFPDIAGAYQPTPLSDSFREPPEFNRPMLVLTGERDCFTPTSNLQQSHLRCAQLVHAEIPGAYHDTLLLGDESARRLTEFLTQN